MTRFLRTLAIGTALGFAVASSVLPARAVAPAQAAQPVIDCDLEGLLTQLQGVKTDGSVTSTQQELDLRKQILTRSMECNAREASALADTVAGIEGNSRNASSLKKRYENALDQAAAYAIKQSQGVAALQTVTSTKDFAVALRTWRTDTYNPLAWEASQLIILDRNLGLAASSQARLEQLQAATANVQDVAGAAEVRDELGQAATLIADATTKLDGAVILLRDKPIESQEVIAAAQKTGLDELSQAYKFLLDGNAKLADIPVPAE